MTTREVVLEGGSPWGFRIHGGADTTSPLKISRVNSNGKAALKGVQEGDIISSINGHPTTNFTCSEAHTFIKNSGDRLKLELSNDSGSTRQRKRNKATIHETNSETVKSTSSTLYTRISSKTIFCDDTNEYNDPGRSFRKQPSLEGQNRTREYPDPPLSPNSTVSSDVSSSSTLTEAGTDRRSTADVTQIQIDIDMGDRANSKSKKKRSKRQRKKSKKTSENVNHETIPVRETLGETLKTENIVSEDYQVDFPETVTSNPKVKVKSKSLDDDDDSLKIQEVTENVEEGKEECDAIISEADSDWEEATDLKVPHKPLSLSTIAISIDEEPLQRIETLSPEEELSLRNFLEDINLVSIVEPSSTKSSLDSIKKEKARKRDALVTYFKPLACNPRYLDIISEEVSDSSDRETPSLTRHLKQGTPELECTPKDFLESSSKILRRRELRRSCLPRNRDRAVLVRTKVISTPSIIEHVHTLATENTEAETVFLDSASASSNDSSDTEEISFDESYSDDDTKSTEHNLDNLKRTSISHSGSSAHNLENVSGEDLIQNNSQNSDSSDLNVTKRHNQSEFASVYEQKNILDGNNSLPSIYIPNITPLDKISSGSENITSTYYDEMTPPPTPDSSPKDKLSAKNSMNLDECMRQISADTAREITAVLQTLTEACNSTVIVNQALIIPPESSANSVSSRSPSNSSSSSRETSPSTVRFNPMNSSIADVTSILSDVELAKQASFLKQPLSLRQICLNFLLSLPCGTEMLQELCDLSLNLDKLTQALNHTQILLESDASARLSNHESISESKETMWTGLPFQCSPNLLLCLSPTQKAYLDKSGVFSREPELLFDLHNKFVQRADQNKYRNNSKDDIEITSIKNIEIEGNNEATSYMNSSTLPRNFKPNNTHNCRLQASNLDEWLKIARSDTISSPTDEILNNHVDSSPPSSINYNFESTKLGTKRRASLPDDLCKRQMKYILEKEKEIEEELHDLLEEKRKLYLEIERNENKFSLVYPPDQNRRARPKSFPSVPGEIFRQKMYQEYMDQVAEREERKQNKIIKITSSPSKKSTENEKHILEVTHIAEIEDEFMKKVQEIHGPLRKVEEKEESAKDEICEHRSNEHESIILMDGASFGDASCLPKHLKEFVEITSECSKVENYPDSTNGVWSPGQKQEFTPTDIKNHQRNGNDEAIPTIWQPKSATSSPSAERKEFRAVSFESPKLSRKNKSEEVLINFEKSASKPPWQPSVGSDIGNHPSASLEKQFPSSHLAPSAGYNDFTTSRLPRAQNPTITLLQKAREGQLPKGAIYIEANRDHYNIPHDSTSPGELLHPRRSDILSESDIENSRRMVDSSRRKINGVGPITKDGMPLSLRSEVKDSNQSKWYKKMYDTIHKQKPYKDEYVTVRYKQRRAQYPYITGYLSEPEPGAYDSDHMNYKYATLDRRRTPISEKENFATSTMPRNIQLKTSSSFDTVHCNTGSKLNPGRIENYTPGHSSIQEQESKRWWDEVMDIFDGWIDDNDDFRSLSAIPSVISNFVQEKKPITKGYMSQALKESGYESDSTLIFKRKEEGCQLSPSEQKEAYKIIQKGGDIPLHGLRKAAPERPKENSFRPVSPFYTDSSTLNNIIPQQEIFCYPMTVHPKRQVFADYKRTAPPSTSTSKPPSPPKRRSSRNNTTLRLITTMKVGKEKLPICKRHEICFTSISDVEKSNVKYLRDKISCKLSPSKTKKAVKVVTPQSNSTANIPTTKYPVATKVSSDISSSKITHKIKSEPSDTKDSKNCRTYSSKALLKVPRRLASKPVGTFGTEKRKILMNLPKFFEDKKSSQLSFSNISAKDSKTLPCPLSPSNKNNPMNVKEMKYNMSEEGKRLFSRGRSPSPPCHSKSNVRYRAVSPIKSTTIDSSWESLKSPTLVRKERTVRSNTNSKNGIISTVNSSKKELKKSKKEEINGKIASKKLSSQSDNTRKSRNMGTEARSQNEGINKKVEQFGSNIKLTEIQRRHKAVHSNRFFQHLFLGDEVHQPSFVKKNCWLYEEPFQKCKDHPTEQNARAMKMYLNHTKPVTDSKFRNIDIRTRSVSPKSLTFEKKLGSNDSINRIGRSVSLPPKLIHFSETSRPVSPVVHKRIMESLVPPEFPGIARSPSQRRIDALKQAHYFSSRKEEKNPYEAIESGCNKLIGTSKLAFEKSTYPKELPQEISFSKRCNKFKDLNEFYSTLEKLGELERATNNTDTKIRKRSEGEIVDYDRWKEVHQKERAEKEINYLCEKLKKKEEDEGFLFRPKGVVNYKWRCELDRGLRIREKSVENIKKDFEKMKIYDPTHMEKIFHAKDTYKPLWRGNSVLNLASHMVARRSQSEGRVPQGYQKFSSSDKLLTRGIGSRIWSSLSVDQVNILKGQLTEIYDQNSLKQTKTPEFNIYVPAEHKSTPARLTVRRNSDILKPASVYKNSADDSLSETEKKRISQSLGNEVMNRINKTVSDPAAISNKNKNSSKSRNKIDINHVTEKSASDRQQEETSYSATGKEKTKLKQITKLKGIEKDEITIASGSDSGKEGKIKSSESGSTDESTRTVIFVEKTEDIRKKVDYFEKASEKEEYIPIIHKPAENEIEDERDYSPDINKLTSSNSCQDFKELFGEKEIVRLATRPLSATRKSNYTSPSLQLRTTNLSPCKLSISDATSCDSIYRSRSLSPFFDEPQTIIKSGEVRRLKDKFEYERNYYSNGLYLKPRRCFSDSNLYKKSTYLPALTYVDVDSLRRKYEYPVHAGRGRSRIRRGGVVSPIFLRAEDRFMPHINIISKIASLCSRKYDKLHSPTDEDLSEILNFKSGDVGKLREKFDKRNDISLLGKMFTSSPDIKELRDIAPYLTASWTAHRFPRSIENTISLISPDESPASMDTSLVRKVPVKPTSPQSASKSSILKTHQRARSAEFPSKTTSVASNSNGLTSEPNLDEVRYRTHWTSVHSKPSVTFKEPEPPLPPPKGLHGPRESQQGSPKKYVENQVTIHYKTPVRQEIKEYYSEDELAHRQQEAMKKIYQEERRRKYLQELQDMHNRRHTDNFISSQKSPIALNRYDDFDELVAPQNKIRPRSPEPRLVARALYNFVGMTPRELTFRKGDNIYVRRQIDKNWYEGELNAMVGLFPVNYVEIIPYENVRTTPRKPHEGQARAKYNFLAKTHLELSLAKGEMVIITRRVDSNWYEGKIGGRRGIFPASYVDVLIDPQEASKDNPKPVASPAAHSLLLNGSNARESMGSHTYAPNLPNPEPAAPRYFAKPIQTNYFNYENRNPRETEDPMSRALHIDTQSVEPISYRALYKYLPQNDDELELMEGDKIYVLEKCDDGWFVGSNERTGAFGTFPGNYVDKM